MGKTNKDVKATLAYMSGFCGEGNHEAPGGEYKPGEAPRMQCRGRFEMTGPGKHRVVFCGCDCHAKITALFESMSVERVWPDSNWRSPADQFAFQDTQPKFDLSWLSEWAAPHTPEPLPENAADLAPTVADLDKEDGAQERTLDTILPPNPTRPNGWNPGDYPRPAGALEFEVKLACDQWLLGGYSSTTLTPIHISRIIGRTSKTPSTGAITNILVAWAELGFAVVELTSPRHFKGYTEAGVQLGIEKLRERKAAQNGAANRASVARLRVGDFKRA